MKRQSVDGPTENMGCSNRTENCVLSTMVMTQVVLVDKELTTNAQGKSVIEREK